MSTSLFCTYMCCAYIQQTILCINSLLYKHYLSTFLDLFSTCVLSNISNKSLPSGNYTAVIHILCVYYRRTLYVNNIYRILLYVDMQYLTMYNSYRLRYYIHSDIYYFD